MIPVLRMGNPRDVAMEISREISVNSLHPNSRRCSRKHGSRRVSANRKIMTVS